MRTTSVKKEILVHLEKLPEPLQRQVLGYIHRLERKTTRGEPGRNILDFAGTIPVDDLKAMAEAIEDGCEKVDANPGGGQAPFHVYAECSFNLT